jgi:hypothetical protein
MLYPCSEGGWVDNYFHTSNCYREDKSTECPIVTLSTSDSNPDPYTWTLVYSFDTRTGDNYYYSKNATASQPMSGFTASL